MSREALQKPDVPEACGRCWLTFELSAFGRRRRFRPRTCCYFCYSLRSSHRRSHNRLHWPLESPLRSRPSPRASRRRRSLHCCCRLRNFRRHGHLRHRCNLQSPGHLRRWSAGCSAQLWGQGQPTRGSEDWAGRTLLHLPSEQPPTSFITGRI